MSKETTHRATKELGEAVVGNELRWASASLITQADPRSEGGCLRAVWYERVGGRERETTEQMRSGTAIHTEIENYLTTGVAALSPTVMAGRGFIPEPGPRLFLEQSIWKVGLTAAGVPIAGHIDVVNTREEYIDARGELRSDPTNTVEALDWKTTSDLKWAKTAAQVAETIQMNTYGSAIFVKWPQIERVRLTHVYFQRGPRPKAQLSTSLRTREEIAGRWAYAEGIVRTIKDAIRETDANKVPGNARSCHSYNKACPHLSVCSVGSHNSLDGLFSKVAEDFNKDFKMGLLTNLPGMAPIPQAPTAPAYTAPQPDPGEALRHQLAVEEARLRAQQVQTQQMPGVVPGPPPGQPMPLRDLWQRIQMHQRGLPALGGAAAQAVAAASGIQISPGAGLAGGGQLAGITIMDPAHLYQLAGELEGNPHMYALPSAQVPVQVVPPPQYAPIPGAQTGGLLPPDAPSSNPAFASAGPPVQNAPTEAAPRGRGRPKKVVSDTAPQAPVAAPPATQAAPPPPAAPVSPFPTAQNPASSDSHCVLPENPMSSMLEVFVDCRPAHDTVSLHPYIDTINAELSKRYCAGGIQDVRCAPKDSPLAYGGWKGALHEIVRTNPPPDASYHVLTTGNEMAEIVADALRVVCAARGAIYVRSVR